MYVGVGAFLLRLEKDLEFERQLAAAVVVFGEAAVLKVQPAVADVEAGVRRDRPVESEADAEAALVAGLAGLLIENRELAAAGVFEAEVAGEDEVLEKLIVHVDLVVLHEEVRIVIPRHELRRPVRRAEAAEVKEVERAVEHAGPELGREVYRVVVLTRGGQPRDGVHVGRLHTLEEAAEKRELPAERAELRRAHRLGRERVVDARDGEPVDAVD